MTVKSKLVQIIVMYALIVLLGVGDIVLFTSKGVGYGEPIVIIFLLLISLAIVVIAHAIRLLWKMGTSAV